MKPTMKEIKEELPYFDTYSLKNGIFTVRKGFFYTFGKNIEIYEDMVKNAFPNAKIIDSQEIWKPFRGGASIANSSHWFVKFTFKTGE